MATTKNPSQVTVSQSDDPNSEKQIHYIVGIGASAGGLMAINAFFDQVPSNSRLSFVLVQHLWPDYKSMMPELLTKHTSLKVENVTDAVTVEPNTVYTIPADKNISISDGKLYLEARASPKTLNLPINIFFKSLAEDQKEKAIGVVLSGTGSDATLGIKAIKEQGGMVIAQDPHTAEFDSMPRSAIATGLVDFIVSPSSMSDIILSYMKNPRVEEVPFTSGITDLDGGDGISQILVLLHQKTNRDFRRYKKATIARRIERRMSAHNINSWKSYLRYLQGNSKEVELLSADMLIGVTSFFRDKKAYEELDKNVITQLVQDHNEERELRLWVVGCSTGQEVYSLAILLMEKCRKQNKHIPIKIFGTDIDQRAVDQASKGIFSKSIEKEIPKELLDRYFTLHDKQYQVKKELRELAIFAEHDISKDPPFNNIDLASCRNLLIYAESELQQQILSFIHFSLRESGYLFLGSSENLGNYARAFDEISGRHNIYQNRSSVRVVDINRLHPFSRRRKLISKQNKPEEQLIVLSESKIINNFKDALLEDMVPPTIIVNESNEVVHIAGEVERFIRLPKKQLTLNVLKMIDEQFYVTLSNLITKVRNQRGKVVSSPVSLDDQSHTSISVVAKRYSEPLSRQNYCIISFIEVNSFKKNSSVNGEESSGQVHFTREEIDHIRQLEEDLKETKDYLQATIEELETSNEELQATNEELMTANEELQSSNEELHSVNEELHTVNSEFQEKIHEMSGLNDDLNNFIQNTHIPTLFLDIDFSIRRYTEDITKYIKITPNDVGRYVGDFNHSFLSFDIIEVAQSVVESFLPVEKEVLTSQNEVFLMKAIPYKTTMKEVKGVVFTFVQVTELKKVEHQLVTKAKELERSNQELEQFAYVASHDLKAPISNMSALLDMIHKRNGVKEECMEIFDKLSESADRMNRTIRTLNEVIIIKKNLDLEPEKLALPKVLEDVLLFIEDQVVSSGAEIITDFAAGDSVYFPEIHLRSVLQNLLTNAIKYRRTDVPPVIELSTSEAVHYFCLSVKDNGRGINLKESRSRMFNLFQRFHPDIEGKGIGLHIVKSIIEKYGGKIEVESSVGRGTTFKLYLQHSPHFAYEQELT